MPLLEHWNLIPSSWDKSSSNFMYIYFLFVLNTCPIGIPIWLGELEFTIFCLLNKYPSVNSRLYNIFKFIATYIDKKIEDLLLIQ